MANRTLITLANLDNSNSSDRRSLNLALVGSTRFFPGLTSPMTKVANHIKLISGGACGSVSMQIGKDISQLQRGVHEKNAISLLMPQQ